MQIQIHRGLDQIGGCITEIRTSTSRIFIDMGQNLPGVGQPTTLEEDQALVKGIFAQSPRRHQAVIYTHAHEDHVGLFFHVPTDVPQYIGEGSKELLLAKYKLILERHIHGGGYKSLFSDCKKIVRIKTFHTWKRADPNAAPQAFTIGDIRITPFFNCHSIYDSYMFLIEADGKRIWHTGDYREHGYMGKGLIPTLKKYATNIDVLITEGTMLKREDECIHEREVSKEMASVMQAFKYVFVLASATDIERLAAIKEATKCAEKPFCICSKFMKKTMGLFTERESKLSQGLFAFDPLFFSDRLFDKLKRRGFAMVAGPSQIERVQKLLERLPQEETLLIYSSWDGYYKDPEQVKVNPKYKEFRDMFPNVVDIHTSGHADRATIKKVIETVKPKEVICIHKEADAEL